MATSVPTVSSWLSMSRRATASGSSPASPARIARRASGSTLRRWADAAACSAVAESTRRSTYGASSDVYRAASAPGDDSCEPLSATRIDSRADRTSVEASLIVNVASFELGASLDLQDRDAFAMARQQALQRSAPRFNAVHGNGRREGQPHRHLAGDVSGQPLFERADRRRRRPAGPHKRTAAGRRASIGGSDSEIGSSTAIRGSGGTSCPCARGAATCIMHAATTAGARPFAVAPKRSRRSS